MRTAAATILAVLLALFSTFAWSTGQSRRFIAHRGVDLGSTIAGENSLEAIALARDAGFDAVETDVRLTADDTLVVMHDATLNRTCLRIDGTPLSEPVEVGSLTWARLQEGYRLKADSLERRSNIPSLAQYLRACRQAGLTVFIEPKLHDPSGRHYARIISTADSILGRDNYIITSNNRANDVIRDTLGVDSLRLMGILYQTDYRHLHRLGDVIVAISAKRIADREFVPYARRAHVDGHPTESHADNAASFTKVNNAPIDWVSTDLLVPDYKGQGSVIRKTVLQDFTAGNVEIDVAEVPFGGLYLRTAVRGTVEFTMGREKFTVTDDPYFSHQVALYGPSTRFTATPLGEGAGVEGLELLQVCYRTHREGVNHGIARQP